MTLTLTTDDLNQDDWTLFKHFDKLHEDFPQMKLLAFFTPLWHHKPTKTELVNGISITDDFWKPEFLEFLRERKGWLSLAAHGLFHNTPDCYGDENCQRIMFKKCLNVLGMLHSLTGIRTVPYFKPPWYRWKEFTPPLCFECAYQRFYIPDGYYEKTIIEVPGKNKAVINKVMYPLVPREKVGLIDTHVSITDRMPNRIDRYYETLRKLLVEQYGEKRS